MEEQMLYEVIEQLNKEKKEIRASKYYKIGAAITLYGEDLRRLNFRHLIKNLKDKRAKRIIEEKYAYRGNELKPNIKIVETCRDKRIAIYTCITGGYDSAQIPLVRFDNVDYILFTDQTKKFVEQDDKFIIREIPDEICAKGQILANRYIKFHPHELLHDYDYSIYLDGNIRVVSDIRGFVKQCTHSTGIAMHRHRERNCIYKEAEVCKLLRRGNTEKINTQMAKYRAASFPSDFGMNEANVIVCNLHNSMSIKLLDDWWNELLVSGSLRDQLAWPYVLWVNGFSIDDVGNLGYNVYENDKIDVVRHC